jgi:nicotinamide riboside kinase
VKSPERPALAPVIALLGGESSGKSTLALALHHCLSQTHGLRVAHIPEILRTWCQNHQRAPLANEQWPIANEQTRLIQEAQAEPGVQLVIADTTALNVAAYSALYFADQSLLPAALHTQQGFAATLLMGLDLPWEADGLFRDSPLFRTRADALLRAQLDAQRIPYQTIYGTGQQRLRNALRALTPILSPLLGQAPVPTDDLRTQGRPGWVCEACSDPECEHRLFTGLLKRPRAASEQP